MFKNDYVKGIILTGSSGYLGQHFLASILSTPPCKTTLYHVYALYRSAQDFPQAVEAIQCADNVSVTVECLDFTDQEQLQAWATKHANDAFNVCIHTAALSSPKLCQQDAATARACNVPKLLFNLLEQRSVPIIALSTDQVYDGASPPYAETDSTGPCCNVYSETKLEMEQYLQSLKLPSVAILRSSIILGPVAPVLPDVAHTTFLHFCASRNGVDTEFYTDERRSVVSTRSVVEVLMSLLVDAVAVSSGIDSDTTTACHGCNVYNMGGASSQSRFDMAIAVFEHLNYDTRHVIAATKADLPAGPIASPLDISMSSGKLETLTKLQFQTLDEMVQATFPSGSTAV